MLLTQKRSRFLTTVRCFILMTITSLFALPFSANAEHLLALQLAPTPFSPSMCKISKDHASIRILAAKHHNLFLKKVPGQYQPENATQSRKKDYVHFVTLADLTDSRISHGAIAFDNHYAVIFDEAHPKGLSRPKFMAQLADSQRLIVEMALNTFLRLHTIFNSAIDTCLPHPAFSDYENDDHVLRIQTGQHTFKDLVKQYNKEPTSPQHITVFESGTIGGYIDPEADNSTTISYQAMNPPQLLYPNLVSVKFKKRNMRMYS